MAKSLNSHAEMSPKLEALLGMLEKPEEAVGGVHALARQLRDEIQCWATLHGVEQAKLAGLLQERTMKMEADLCDDVAQRKRGEEEIRQLNATLEDRVETRTRQLSDANTELQIFSSTAAHDLRSPLRRISNFSEALLEEYGAKLDQTGTFYLERISHSAAHMARLLDDLLEYSRTTQAELKLVSVNLEEAVQAALELTEGASASRAEIIVEKPFPPVTGHRATVVMIINNLIANALKFIAPGVQPRVRIRPEREAGSHVRLWIEDNGIGIKPEDVGKLFNAFQRLHSKEKYPGTGLGLALVRRGAERMGGRVGIESNSGGGSRFWVDLPSAA